MISSYRKCIQNRIQRNRKELERYNDSRINLQRELEDLQTTLHKTKEGTPEYETVVDLVDSFLARSRAFCKISIAKRAELESNKFLLDGNIKSLMLWSYLSILATKYGDVLIKLLKVVNFWFVVLFLFWHESSLLLSLASSSTLLLIHCFRVKHTQYLMLLQTIYVCYFFYHLLDTSYILSLLYTILHTYCHLLQIYQCNED